jgi:uncharacterized protein YxjI
MRYRMHHKIFALGTDYAVTDDAGQTRYIVDGKVFALGHRLIFKDPAGNALATIHQRLIALRPTYEIERAGQEAAEVRKRLSLFGERFVVDIPGPDDLEVNGDVFDHEYSFTRAGQPVAQVSKRWFSLTDAYGVEVADGQDDLLILASAVVIDLINEDREHHA